jgi:CDP-glucose 4,6-dehydratase
MFVETIKTGNKSGFIDLSFFRDKRIFVTGHTGFKGSWLSLILIDAGAIVTGYALPAEEKSNFRLLGLDSRMNSIEGNIKDKVHLKKALSDFQPEIVFHLAAQPIVSQSYIDPLDTFETNILGSANLLAAVASVTSVRSLIYITSDKCYENREWAWGYRESDALGGFDPYSASKAAAELIFSSYSRSFLKSQEALFAATARAGNVIGGGDWSSSRIIPDCIRAIEQNRSVEIRNPHATRPWQHVFEPLFAYLLLAKKLYFREINNFESWNFGPAIGDVKKVVDVVEKFHHEFGEGSLLVQADSSLIHEANLLQLNCDKAYSQLGWMPKWDTGKAISMTANWYKCLREGKDMIQVSRLQLLEYVGENHD